MKKIVFLIFVCVILTACQSNANVNNTVQISDIEDIFSENLSSDIGYCDVSIYYRDNYFSDIINIEECKIYTSNDSTNFDEFGIFRFADENSARKARGMIKQYLNDSRNEFENGIIYNIQEYPKFQNADVKLYGKYLIYTILSPEKTEKIYTEIKSM